jgi:hypothetical protein
MLIHPTVERLRSLGLSAMADAVIEMQTNAEAADLPHADWLGLLTDREVTCPRQSPLRPPPAGCQAAPGRIGGECRRPHAPRARSRSVPEPCDEPVAARAPSRRHHRPDRHRQELAGLCPVGHRACRDGFSVLYKRAPRLFADLAQARGEGRIARLILPL